MEDSLKIGSRNFGSRLFLGTGKFASYEIMRDALQISETEMVTVALRRVDFSSSGRDILSFIDQGKTQLLPNTSGAKRAQEAIKLAHLAREAGLGNWVKVEVIPDPKYLLPDGEETLKASAQLVQDGFVVLPYIQADPILAKKLADVGCAAVMPLGSWIGSNRGLKTKEALQIIIEQSTIPVVIDAGLGLPSHAAEAMELGADAVLVNTAIATARNPVAMAQSFAKGVEAGRQGFLAQAREMLNEGEVSSLPEGSFFS